jgi:hypothetical protein
MNLKKNKSPPSKPAAAKPIQLAITVAAVAPEIHRRTRY